MNYKEIMAMSIDEILIDALQHELRDRLINFPPPPEGYVYAYDFPVMEHNPETECWDVHVDLCLRDRSGRMIRLPE